MELLKKKTCLLLQQDIITFCRKNKINLSEWVNVEFTQYYLSLEKKKQQIETLQNEIKQIEARADVLNKELTSREIRYIYQVTPRRKEGKKMPALLAFFNNEYHRNLTLSEFEAIVNFYEKAAINRIKAAMERKNEERRH